MMDDRFLSLIPERILCPYCGEWHKWESSRNLKYYDSEECNAEITCKHSYSNTAKLVFFFRKDRCYYKTTYLCFKAYIATEDIVSLSSFKEDETLGRFILQVPVITNRPVGSYECSDCHSSRWCNICQLGEKGDNRHVKITFGFEFNKSDYDRIVREIQFSLKEQELQSCTEAVEEQERALKEKEEALFAKERNKQSPNDQQETKNKEDITMEEKTMVPFINDIAKDFGINFGFNTDERIRSTIMGTVVEYSPGHFRGFDRERVVMTDYANLATISLPSAVLPSTTVKVGDTIIHNGEPFFIMKDEDGDVWGASPITSKEEKLIPIANPLGIKTYTRLVSVGEVMGFTGSNPQNMRIVLWLLTMVASKLCNEGIESANEKIKAVTDNGEKYVELLLPFACVAFAAYAMKGSDMRLNNISASAKKAFGIDFECLNDRKTLQRIAAIGVATATAVTCFNKAVTKAATSENSNGTDVEPMLNKLLKAVKPFESTIKKVLPAALLICAVKCFNGDIHWDDIRDKFEGGMLIAEDVFCEKLGVSEEFFNKENLKKVAILAGIAIFTFIVYGKKLNSKDKDAQQTNNLIGQIMPIIAPVIPALILFAPQMKGFFGGYKTEDPEVVSEFEEQPAKDCEPDEQTSRDNGPEELYTEEDANN